MVPAGAGGIAEHMGWLHAVGIDFILPYDDSEPQIQAAEGQSCVRRQHLGQLRMDLIPFRAWVILFRIQQSRIHRIPLFILPALGKGLGRPAPVGTFLAGGAPGIDAEQQQGTDKHDKICNKKETMYITGIHQISSEPAKTKSELFASS